MAGFVNFLSYFADLWKPYNQESVKIQTFFQDYTDTGREHGGRPKQFNVGEIKYDTYVYDLEAICSFQILQISELNLGVGLPVRVTFPVIEEFSMFPNPK